MATTTLPTESPSRSAEPYSPPQHLLVYWTAEELISQFEAFRNNLKYEEPSPELVFERLVGGLIQGLDKTIKRENSGAGKLRAATDALQDAIAELHKENAACGVEANATGSTDTIAELPAQPEDELVDLVFKFVSTQKEVHTEGSISTPKSPVHPGGSTWEDIAFPASDFESGFQTITGETPEQRVSSGEKRVSSGEHRISFEGGFTTIPKVVVWLTHVNYTTSPLSIFLSAVEVDGLSFRLKLNIRTASVVHAVGFGWVAYPGTRAHTDSGSLDTFTGDEWKYPKFEHSGSHPIKMPEMPPLVRTFAAVNGVDMAESTTQLTLKASVTVCKSPKGDSYVQWEYSVGPPDANVSAVGISYLITA